PVSLLYTYFVFLIRRYPTSRGFPYTTLFRSRKVFVETGSLRTSPQNLCYCGPLRHETVNFSISAISGARRMGSVSLLLQHDLHLDRKSTRLNSSHVKISYAVFCLKKKNY